MRPFLSRILTILTSSAGWKITLLLMIFFPTAILEALAVFSVLPLIKVLTSPEHIYGHPIMLLVEKQFGPLEPRVLGLLLSSATLLLLFSANVLGAFSVWMVQRFCREEHNHICYRLFQNYLFMPFALLRKHNSNDIAKIILSETQQFIYAVLLPFLDIISRLLTTIVVLILLLWINPLLTLLSVFILAVAYSILYLAIRRFLFNTGKKMVEANSNRFRIVREALEGVKWLKLRGLQSACLDLFTEPTRTFSRHQFYHELCSRTARYVVETVALGGAVFVIVILIWQRKSTPEIVAMTGVVAFASYRLLPSLQQVFVGLTRIRAHEAVLESLHRALDHPSFSEEQHSEVDLHFQHEIRLNNITFYHGDSTTELFKNLNLTIKKGEILGIAGPTGCGKTTLLDILLGLLTPHSGSLEVDGKPIVGSYVSAWQRRLGYVPQHIHLIDATIRDNIAWAKATEGAVIEAAQRAGIASFIESLPEGYNSRVGDQGTRLSGGQVQRIGIARAIYHRPEVLVLDEATSALDGHTEDLVMRSILELAHEMTIILVAHRLETLRRCSRIILLDQGKIVATGNYAELETSCSLFRRMAYGKNDCIDS